MNGAAPIGTESHRTLRKQSLQTWEKYSITCESPRSASSHPKETSGEEEMGKSRKEKKMKDKEYGQIWKIKPAYVDVSMEIQTTIH